MLVAHHHHKEMQESSRVQLIHVPYPNATIQNSEKRDLTPGTEVIVSVVHASHHFAVLEIVLSTKMVNVIYGLSLDSKKWLDHVVNIFV